MPAALRHGDYTGLADAYSRYRPGYSPHAARMILALLQRPPASLDAVDVGAGTGIWTRELATQGFRSLTAIEPNDDMRRCGVMDSTGLPVTWRAGRGEETGLPSSCCDLVSMASSFHWVDTERGLAEFHRLLRPGGRFVALWNPRLIEVNPLLVEIEAMLQSIGPEIERRSSGRSGLTDRLGALLAQHRLFDDLVYAECRHAVRQTPAEYLGVWRSVNDVQVQLGPQRWQKFLREVERLVVGRDHIETTYLTRLWTVRRRDSAAG
jgi:SAM-dependent methyltransferase